jgi:hypothetical protein
MREASEDGGSVTSRRRKEPIRDDRDRDRDYERDRGGSRDRRDRRDDYRRDDDYDRRGGDKERDHKRGKGRDDRRVERRDSRSKWASPRDDTPKKRDPPPHERMDERAEKVSHASWYDFTMKLTSSVAAETRRPGGHAGGGGDLMLCELLDCHDDKTIYVLLCR